MSCEHDDEGVDNIRETLFGSVIGKRILDVTEGEGEYSDKIYFHMEDGQTFFATIGNESNPGLMGFIDMEAMEDGDESSDQAA